jgi:hypothetical protein
VSGIILDTDREVPEPDRVVRCDEPGEERYGYDRGGRAIRQETVSRNGERYYIEGNIMKKRFAAIPLFLVSFFFLWKYWVEIFVFLFGLVFYLSADWDVQKKILSPDGKYVAECLILNAGATTSYSPQVSVKRSYTIRLQRTGNIFIGYRSQYIDIEWKDDNTLIIYHDCEPDNIFKQEETYGNVHVEFIKKRRTGET